jgi:hypothetical protein
MAWQAHCRGNWTGGVPRHATHCITVIAPGVAWIQVRGQITHSAATRSQVVGHKYIRLYDCSQSPYLYASKAGGTDVQAQGNLSAVDVEAADAVDKFPLFANAGDEPM